MAHSLWQLTRRLAIQPQKPLVSVPVLIWEAPPSESNPEEDWAPTEAGDKSRPTATDPLVFLVEKVPNRPNPFAMGITVGRVESNDIIVDDASVSRFHAWLQLEARKKQWFLCDAESRNGTFVGEQRLTPNRKAPIADGMVLRFGDARMRFLEPESLVRHIRDLRLPAPR